MKKNRRMFFLGLFFSTSVLFAQAPDTLWTKTYGGRNADFGHSVQQTSDGGYVICGTTWSFGAGISDVYVIKTDADGDTLWTKTYGTAMNEWGHSIRQTTDGAYIISAAVLSAGRQADIVLIKIDANGDTIWAKTYVLPYDEYAYSIQQTGDKGYILVGYTESIGAGSRDVYLLKVDSLGNEEWSKAYGRPNMDIGQEVQQTNDGGYIAAGMTTIGNRARDFYLIKTDSLGDTLWTKTYGDTLWDECYSVQQTADSGYILAGYTQAHLDTFYLYVVKTNSLGDTIWSRKYSTSLSGIGSFTEGRAIRKTYDGNYIIIGQTFITDNYDFCFLKIDTNGDTLWTKVIGGSMGDYAWSVEETSDHGCVGVGYTFSFGAGERDVYLVRLAPETNIFEEKTALLGKHNYGASIISGALPLPSGKRCKVFDITGRVVSTDKIRPGIYFIEIEGKILRKVVKVR